MSLPQWKGLFEWSMKHADGTRVADMRQIEVDPQKMAWLQEVLSNYVKDLVKRLREIKVALEQPENQNIGLEEQEALLDELQEIVEDIDQAKNLHIIGGVPLLIDLLQSSEAFFDEGLLPLVLSVALSEDQTCRLKGWMAISCMIRNFNPASEAFLQADGIKHLFRAIENGELRLKRRGLFLLEYLIFENGNEIQNAFEQSRFLQNIIDCLESEDNDVREKALGVLNAVIHSGLKSSILENTTLKVKMDRLGIDIGRLSEDERECRLSEIEQLNALKAKLKE